MTARTQYEPEPWEAAIQAWLQAAMDKVGSGIPVIYANQSAPRPAWPYVTLQPVSVVDVGQGERALVDEAGGAPTDYEYRVDQIKRGSVSVKCFGFDARNMAQTASMDFKLPSSVETNRAAGLSIIGVDGGPNDVSVLEDEQPYRVMQLDLAFLFSLRLTEDVGSIQEIHADGTVGEAPVKVDYP